MTPEQATDRIILSRRVLAGWRQHPPGGSQEDALRMVAEEIAALEAIALEHTGKAESMARLIADWREFGDRLRARLH